MELRLPHARPTGRVPDLNIRVAQALALTLLSLALVHAVSSLAVCWNMPLLDRHGFRQTQTALSARLIAQGGPVLAYETPLFGAPWSIPFEFPLFQLMAAGASSALGMPLDQAGRLISSAFFLATILPLWFLLRELGVPLVSRSLGIACFLVSPLYVYWSRAFLMESTVLFFSVAACTLGLAALRRPAWSPRLLMLASACAIIASAMKLTTAFGWLVFLAAFWLASFRRESLRSVRAAAPTIVFGAALFLAPLLVASLWTAFADGVKGENLLARDFLRSSVLRPWLYGTWEQKLSLWNWAVLIKRTLDHTLGHFWLFGACTVLGFLGRRWLPTVAPLLGMVASYATFTNLHLVHDYYQYATGLFLILSTAVGLGVLERMAGRAVWLVPSGVAVALLQSKWAYEAGYRRIQTSEYTLQARDLGHFIRAHTSPMSSILIYGDDWTPIVPYYAERRAIMNRWNYPLTEPRLRTTLERTDAAGYPLGAVVGCSTARETVVGIAHAAFNNTPVSCAAVTTCLVCTPLKG